MRVTVIASGTRGDVQPMIALGKAVQAAGHTVTLIAGSNFAKWIQTHGLGFSATVDIEAMMHSDKGVEWAARSDSPMQQLRLMRQLLSENEAALYDPIIASVDSTDLYLGGLTGEPFVQAISEKTGIPYVNVLLQPRHATGNGSANLRPIFTQRDSLFNRWTGQFAEFMLWWVAEKATNHLRVQKLGLPAHNAKSFAATSWQAVTLAGYSPLVTPKPHDWPQNLTICGYWFLDDHLTWQPPAELTDFLQAGAPPVYFGFGSMFHRDPQQTLDQIILAAERVGVRAVVSGWGVTETQLLNTTTLQIRGVPHHWLFPHMAAVVHHGGAGTTSAALRAGKPSLIVPHLGDQPYWGRRVHELGLGVKPVPIHQLTADRLAHSLRHLLQDSSIQNKAAAFGERIRQERGLENAVHALNRIVT